jgi:alpha-glucosidase
LMPYLYTLAEETTRTGLPMVRPLFLEFPDAAADGHPLDLDGPSAGEFLLGSSLLIAPSPWPEQLDDYLAEVPSADWYDYWTGKKIEPFAAPPDPAQPASASAGRFVTVKLHPELASLPVFVRGGAIVPIAPLVQSTNEKPQGPLTLRIYRGGQTDPCVGSIYLDDGKTFAYTKGSFLRINFTCNTDSDGAHIHISTHEGSYKPWWTEIRAEMYGWGSDKTDIQLNGAAINKGSMESLTNGISVTFADDGKGQNLQLR